MKALNYLGTAALAAYAIFALTACNGTSNGSTNTATCTLNTVTGMYVDQNGNACAGTSSTVTTCPSTGIAIVNGVQQACTPGQIISTGTGTGTIGGAPAGYPYGSNPAAGSGCTSYYYIYGVQYVPIYYNGTLMCANYPDLIQSMSTQYYSSYTSTPYYNDPSYWYQYPPYGGSSYYGQGSAYFSGYGATGGYGGSSFSLNLGIGLSFGF